MSAASTMRYHRTGTLWEGRYKACPVEDGEYLMHCHRYIELNPLRAGMVADPADYPWSSHGGNASGTFDPLISHHPSYLSLARDPDERRALYRAFVMETVSADELDAVRQHVQRQHAFGTNRFREAIEAQLGRPAGPQKIGRPRRISKGHSDPCFSSDPYFRKIHSDPYFLLTPIFSVFHKGYKSALTLASNLAASGARTKQSAHPDTNFESANL